MHASPSSTHPNLGRRLASTRRIRPPAGRLALVGALLLMVISCGDDGRDRAVEPTIPLEVAALEPDADGMRPAPGRPGGVGPSVGPGDPFATWTPSGPLGAATGEPPVPLIGDGGTATGASTDAVPEGTSGRTDGPPAPAEGSAPLPGIPQPTQRSAQSVAPEGPPATDPEIQELADSVRSSRLRSDVRRLVGFGTRHPLSDVTDERRGVGAARNWLVEAFEPSGRDAGSQMVINREPFPFTLAGRTVGQENIMATLTGIGARKRLVYVTAHYDSRLGDIEDAEGDAPGASDNATGVATLLELARVLGVRQWDASIRFVAFAAEEHGMAGSGHHAPQAGRVGLPIEAVYNNDIVGSVPPEDGPSTADDGDDPPGAVVQVFSVEPAAGASRRLARHSAWMAARYGGANAVAVAERDRPGRYGDHLPFSEAGFPAVRLSTPARDPSVQHSDRDTMQAVDPDIHESVTKLNVALVANLALAPAPMTHPPRLAVAANRAGELRVRWNASADPAVSGYWIAWRSASEDEYRAATWATGDEAVLRGLPQATELAVAVAASDDLGHTGLFSPEALVTLP